MKASTRFVATFARSGASRSQGRAAATPAFSSDAKGSGAPSHRRTPLALIAGLALLASLAFAAPASADATVEMGTISNVSYTSAHVTGKVSINRFVAEWAFEYSTDDGATWTPGLKGFFFSVSPIKQEVGGNIAVPKGGTKYLVRLIAAYSNGEPKAIDPEAPGPYPEMTTLTVDPPTIVATDDASEVFSLSAKVTGKVKRPANADSAFDVPTCRFEYVTDAQFTATGFAGAAVKGCENFTPITAPNDEKTVSAHLTGLNPTATYHFRLAAENAAPNAATKEAAHTFTTLPPVAKPVIIATDNAFEVSKRTAKASGEIERPAGTDPALDVNCRFEYVTDAQFTTTGFAGAGQAACIESPIGAGDPPAVTSKLTGLAPDTTYHLRLAAENGGGTVTKDATTFTTLAIVPPTLTVDSITDVGYTSFRITGTFDPGNQGIYPGFQYSPAGKEEWGGSGPAQFVPTLVAAGSPALQSSVNFPCYYGGICGPPLMPGTTYQARAYGYDNEFGGIGDLHFSPKPYAEFTTKGTSTPPTASLDPVTGVTTTTAHISGTVDTHAPAGPLNDEGKVPYKTDWHFECTPECPPAPGRSGTVEGEEGSKAISFDAIRLLPNVYYEVKLVAHNALGTVETPVQTFQTPLVPADVKSSPGGSDGKGGYTLEGVINSNNSKITSCQFEYGTTATYPNTYKIPCLPLPSGPDEVQQVNVDATEGQFKLSFRGQSTTDLAYNASPAAVQSAFRALSTVGTSGVTVTGSAQSYVVTFAGKLAGANIEQLKAGNGTTPLGGGGGASVSTSAEGGKNGPVTVEARLEGLTIGATYHFRIFATNAAGTASSPDRTFVPTKAPPSPECPNEQLRKESLSLDLPECRAYEEVTVGIDSEREGNSTMFYAYSGGDTVAYSSGASNIANSGTGALLGALGYNVYAARRTAAGWETIRNLNGPPGKATPYSAPEFYEDGDVLSSHYSADLLSSVWAYARKRDDPPGMSPYLRKPDGSFHRIGYFPSAFEETFRGASADLSHSVWTSDRNNPGPGVYEFVGTGNDQPRRVDLDNSDSPISSCRGGGSDPINARFNGISLDGSTIVVTVTGGCGGDNPPANEIWARVDGTTSYDVSASQCNRSVGDPGGACNAPAAAVFQFATPDGLHVFFTTTQQLVNGDTDKTNDLYACDLPTTPQAPTGSANPCATFTEVSGAASEAKVEAVLPTRTEGTGFGGPSKVVSDDGSTAYFTAEGVLADNTNAFGEEALAGDHNLYVWRQDAAHPAGQTTFVGRLGDDPLTRGETTPDGRYLALQTLSSLVPTDTDNASDIYRYDAVTGEIVRVSTGISGTGGNAEGFNAGFTQLHLSHASFNPRINISAVGDRIVFTTNEALSPLDGNGGSDVYLWSSGHVYLISGGSVGGEGSNPVISDSGRDIYFDFNNGEDVYDARIGGGFSSPPAPCSGESCQPAATSPPAFRAPSSEQQGSGNPPEPKGCPKGKVKKQGKCVKKASKKHHRKSSHKRASSNGGGGK